jgi:outer membrane protein insertion porin family/translocation and assembly module TamA
MFASPARPSAIVESATDHVTRQPSTSGLRALALAAALASVACSKQAYTPYKPYTDQPCTRPDLTGCVIADVSVVGNKGVPASAIKEKIATIETSRTLFGVLEDVPILSLWDRINVDYEKLDPLVLERDLARVERLYRARGYYEAHARAARVERSGKDRVKIEIVVEEGVPVLVGKVIVDWAGGAAPPRNVNLAAGKAARGLAVGAPFAESAFEETKKNVTRVLTSRGYAYALVEGKATVDLVAHRADVHYDASLGPPTKFGPITIEGAGDLPMDRIRQAIDIKEGTPYSSGTIDSAQVALSDLRVFGSVEAVPQLTPRDKPQSEWVTHVPVVFHVTPTTLKTGKAGFGFEVGSRVAVRGVFGWENRNFLGGLRTLTLEAKPGFVLYPYTLNNLFTVAPSILPELRVHAVLEQPGFIEARTHGILSTDFAMYQLQPAAELGYLEVTGKTGVQRDWWDGRVHVAIFPNVQFDLPVDLHIPVAKAPGGGGYNNLLLPFLQLIGTLDLRRGVDGKRDPINPHSGIYLTNEVQLAAGPSSISSTDVRERVDLRGYIPVSKKLTLALRFSGGVLGAFGGALAQTPYPAAPADYVPLPITDLDAYHTPTNCDPTLPAGQVCRGRYLQLLQLRGFYSGGTNSNRGYAYNGIGPQEQIPGISTLSNSGVPLPLAIGGKALWEASVELRIPVYDKLGMALFVDGSDVRDRLADFAERFAPHLSTGVGIRYGTPVGPLRADLGLRIPGAQVIGFAPKCSAFDPGASPGPAQICQPGQSAPANAYLPQKWGQAGGIPLALSLAIGEAF